MRWPDSDHCQDGRFFTPHAPTQPGFRAIFEWLTHRERIVWPKWIDAPRGERPPERLAADAVRVTFVNHATVLLQIGELNVITDPIWSDRASPVQFTGPRRHRAPGIRFEDLPPIDVILLSHNHYDHLDTGTLLRLKRRDAPTIYCPLGLLRGFGGSAFIPSWSWTGGSSRPFIGWRSTAFPLSILLRVDCSTETARCGADGI
jgi:glyoxylase-like metal-dependent hydrolase (beta-lactamase superfamily II)